MTRPVLTVIAGALAATAAVLIYLKAEGARLRRSIEREVR